MDLSIASILTLDGLTNGAIYALLGMGIVLVFTVTRVIFIPQGEFVAYGALTLAIFQTSKVPGTVGLLLSLLFFGAEGFRNPSFWDVRYALGPLNLSGQTIIIFGASAALIVLLWLFFERSLYGKALRATAANRLGARLMGISTQNAGPSDWLSPPISRGLPAIRGTSMRWSGRWC